MPVAPLDKKYTIEDYLKLDDGRRYELIGGELIVVPRPRPIHQKVVGNIFVEFTNFLRQNPVGEVYCDLDVHLGSEVVAPDILFILQERNTIVGELNIQGAPDLVVEVLSPSTASHDRKQKGRLYFSYGVKEYWLVDPDARYVEVFTAGEKNWQFAGVFDWEDFLTTSLLPGFKLELKNVFNVVL